MGADYLVVARFQKPHGLKGEALVMPITSEPEEVFVQGRRLVPVDDAANPIGPELDVVRARPFSRRWLLSFRGIKERTPLEAWPDWLLGVRIEELKPPEDDEMYVHEIPGAQVVEGNVVLGIAKEVVGKPGDEFLVFESEDREHIIPFKAPIVVAVNRPERKIEVDLPPGLLEL